MPSLKQSLVISELLTAFRVKHLSLATFYQDLLQHIEAAPEHHVWITRLTHEQVFAYVQALQDKSPHDLPLYGVPFVLKDNIDLAGIPTTAGCPQFTHTPQQSATVVQKLIDAGAIPLGKVNMDQFATGLVGTRSPYGAGKNSFDPEYISGGSSSGSALAVALGLASFALGTDTAGSGRVPAAFNNLIGLKPSIGRLSNKGVVPACKSLDCIAIFTLTAADAAAVLKVAEGYDAKDPWSRPLRTAAQAGRLLTDEVRVGIPKPEQLQFFGNTEYERLYHNACATMQALGARLIELDFSPLLAAARLLYEGPWVAERYAVIDDLLQHNPDAVHPVTRAITLTAQDKTAVDTFRAQYRLRDLQRAAEQLMHQADVFMTPTAGTIYRIAEVEADPIQLNSNLGYYTNFMNLLDLAAVATPAGFTDKGLPFGVTLFAQRDTDWALLQLAARVKRASINVLGAMHQHLVSQSFAPVLPDYQPIAVCGAHMQGLPLNYQLTERGAYLLKQTRTQAEYRLYALPGGPPERPGLVAVNHDGKAIDLEVWALPLSEWGSFIAGIPAPLCLGKVRLEDGTQVTGFLCEANATQQARDVSWFGGWRGFLHGRHGDS